MGYRCGACREEIPGGEEVWIDSSGKTIDWKTAAAEGRIVAGPSPRHPACAEGRAEAEFSLRGPRT